MKTAPKSAIEKALERFGEAAKAHGWQEDQGFGRQVDIAKSEFAAARKNLRRAIARAIRDAGSSS
jgi:hypothetical protein